MKKQMVVLMGALVAGVHAAGGADVATTTSAPETLTAAQLLDRFEATQRRTYGSFISRFESESVGELDHNPPFESGRRQRRDVVEIRTDGRRFFWCEEDSGQCYPRLAHATPPTDPRVRCFLYDGQLCYNGGHEPFWMVKQSVHSLEDSEKPKAYRARLRVTISDRFDADPECVPPLIFQQVKASEVPDSLGSGGLVHAPGLVQILRNAKALVLEPKLEPVNGLPCYVLQAALAQEENNGLGQKSATDHVYRIHFDPTHNYHIAKLDLITKLRYLTGEPRVQGLRTLDRQVVDNVRFQQIGECWVPMAWQQSRSTRRLDDPKINSWSKSTVRRTRVLLNPDHDALGSFKPTFIQDGWTVDLRGFDGRFHQAGPLAWKDGYVVNEAGQTLALR